MKPVKSLYTYKPRPFKDPTVTDSKASVDEFNNAFSNTNRKRSALDNINISAGSLSLKKSCVLDVSDFFHDNMIEIDNNNNHVRDEAKAKAKKLLDDFAIDIPAAETIVEPKPDFTLEKAKRLFQSCKKISFDLNNSDTITHDESTSVPTGCSLNTSSLSIPIILTAAERQSIARTAAANSMKSSFNVFDGENSSNVSLDDTGKLSIKTRVNGVHERTWKFSAIETFATIKEQMSEVYGIPAQEISLVFDGELLDEEDTPKNASMETDDLIDAKIPKAKLSDALASEQAYTARVSTVKPVLWKSRPHDKVQGTTMAPDAYYTTNSSNSQTAGVATKSDLIPNAKPSISNFVKLPAVDEVISVQVYVPKSLLPQQTFREQLQEDLVQYVVKVSSSTCLEKVLYHVTKHCQLDAAMCYLVMDDDREIALPLDETISVLGIVDGSSMSLHQRISVTLSIQPGVEFGTSKTAAVREIKLLATTKQLVASMMAKVADRVHRRESELRFILKSRSDPAPTLVVPASQRSRGERVAGSTSDDSEIGVLLVGEKTFLEQGVGTGSVIVIVLQT